MSTNYAKVGPYNIEVSSSHIYLAPDLPQTYDYVPWNAIRHLIREGRIQDVRLIDIGANVGDSLAHFRRFSTAPVDCVEASPYFFEILERNARQFDDVHLHPSLLVPEALVGKVSFVSGGQTGFSTVSDSTQPEHAWAGSTITFAELFRDTSRRYIVKTDTDGFDVQIVSDLLRVRQRLSVDVPIIFFEGPSAGQMKGGDIQDWLELCWRLQSQDFGLLLLTNQGMPYVYAGKSFEAVRSALNALVTGYATGQCLCHYFDFIAVHDSATSGAARLAACWGPDWFDRR